MNWEFRPADGYNPRQVIALADVSLFRLGPIASEVRMPYPHGPNCRCPKTTVADGLLKFTVDCDHYDQLAHALQKIADPQPTVLRVLTTEPAAPDNLVPLTGPSCDGSLVCPCLRCSDERAQRVRQGVRRPVQPWEPVRRRLRDAA